MEDGFELLEQRVHKAATRLRELRSETDGLRLELKKATARAEKAEADARAEKARADSAGRGRAETAERELAALRAEREQLRQRMAGLVNLLETLE